MEYQEGIGGNERRGGEKEKRILIMYAVIKCKIKIDKYLLNLQLDHQWPN